MISPETRTFRAPKQGEELTDCQDSIYPCPGEKADGTFAISDGTTTSFFSQDWANILTRNFSESAEQAFTDWTTWLTKAQDEWRAEVSTRAKAKDANFFTKNDFYAGKPAAATFVGLRLESIEENAIRWRALIVGDSCLFVLRTDGPTCFEIKKAADFSYLVQTVESYAKSGSQRPAIYESAPQGLQSGLESGDAVLLATDAFSKWMLLRHERGEPVWGTILSLRTLDEFKVLISNARKEFENRLENDDVALAVITVGAPHVIYLQQTFVPNSSREFEQSVETTLPPLPEIRPSHSSMPVEYRGIEFQTLAREVWSSDLSSRRRKRISGSWVLRRDIVLALVSLMVVIWLGLLQIKKGRAYVAEKHKTQELQIQLNEANRQLSQAAAQRTELENRLTQSERDKSKSQSEIDRELGDLHSRLTETESAYQSLQKENKELQQKLAVTERNGESSKQELIPSPPVPTAEPSITKPQPEKEVDKPQNDNSPKRKRSKPKARQSSPVETAVPPVASISTTQNSWYSP